MISVLARKSYDDPRVESRRLAVGFAFLIAASMVWFGARGGVVRLLARSSLGCPGREGLIVGALRQEGLSIPQDAAAWSQCYPRPGWVAWTSVYDVEHGVDGTTVAKSQVPIADSDLRVRGIVAGQPYHGQPPVDSDGDGAWEILVEGAPSEPPATKDLTYWGVLRLGARANELVWLGLSEGGGWAGKGARLKPVWREGRGGRKELAFITVAAIRAPQGGLAFKAPETIAVFEAEGGSGLLRPRLLPDDCGITPWNPPNDAPVTLDQRADLELAFRELLPVPQAQPR